MKTFLKFLFKLFRGSNFKQPKIRSEKHRRFVAGLGCCICGRSDVQSAHIRSGGNAGVGLKSCDSTIVPLCIKHHREQHAIGSETKFWEKYSNIEKAKDLASNLYKVSGLEQAGHFYVSRFRKDQNP